MNSLVFDLSTTNAALYAGCELQEVAGKLMIATPATEATTIIGRNARDLIEQFVAAGYEEITLTGGTAIWVYLIVFHLVVHRFRKVYYDNGQKDGKVLIAAHF